MFGVRGPTVVDPPAWLAVLAALATRLADAWFLVVLVTAFYWIAPRVAADPRSVGGTAVGLALASLAVTTGAKAAFALPRPPNAGELAVGGVLAPVVASAVDPSGFGFPSGHALAATLVYGGFAAFLDAGTRRARAVAAGLIVSLVAATRVVLGVHYLGDVLAGIAVGLVTLAAFVRAARRGFRPRPDRALFLAGSLGVLAAVVAAVGGHPAELVEAATAAGAGFGGYVVWRLHGPDETAVGPVAGVVGFALVGAGFGYVRLVAADGVPAVVGVLPDTPLTQTLAASVVAGVAVATLIGWPAVVGRLRTA